MRFGRQTRLRRLAFCRLLYEPREAELHALSDVFCLSETSSDRGQEKLTSNLSLYIKRSRVLEFTFNRPQGQMTPTRDSTFAGIVFASTSSSQGCFPSCNSEARHQRSGRSPWADRALLRRGIHVTGYFKFSDDHHNVALGWAVRDDSWNSICILL